MSDSHLPARRRFFIPWVPKPDTMKRIGRLHIKLYERTHGLIGGRADGLDIFLLTTTGRKTGIERTVAIPYFRRDGKLLTIASYGGNKVHPAWYVNLRANPRVIYQIGGQLFTGTARTTTGEERQRLWDSVAHEHPRFNRYLAWCGDREIPVVVID
ncbi:MAG: nitroreductase family deazaflavin-dependent oxidoreductase [Polyangiales bacterium]|nr:nitroreductase family deazaflavin-dependent oxidoreductase [Myxococcales bacterium]MCB9656611.1 nitroreductase family deazaflavin-dependent oxidoreductase [Sandaracinaceae bacterium]